ncbi:MAG: M28 family peptidase [Chloroflexi bacterium]|nr:MAG: M28 family peptidase [Chloroflexota bacterium]
MQHPIARACCLIFLAISSLLTLVSTTPISANNPKSYTGQHALQDFPTVDPNYIYDRLFFIATSFQHREAGYDNNLPVNENGHDEFAAYWSQEISQNLAGFGPQVRRDAFLVAGWQGRPAVVPAFNVEVTIPGVTHPEQVVVIGCHYDGEAISTQSANDDTSGCAIELGVARAMGIYWRSHHTYPARTLRFVIFDAEEQGLYGSFHYLNNTINGDVNNIVAMFNEEQNGIAYPLRYLGKMSNPLLPFYADMSPLSNSQLYPNQDKLTHQQRASITQFRALMQQAVTPVFQQFQAMGYQTLAYHGDNNQDVTQPVFATNQLNNLHLEDDTLGGSDQIPFTLAGLPCATFAGNSTYYDNNPPPWSYPFDQKEDTIQLMNTFASGSSKKAEALVLALALPGMLTTWMLNQPAILGLATAKNPIATISDIGQTVVNQNIPLNATASYDLTNSPLSYAWDFGDGSTAAGINVNHIYTKAGTYTLTLTIRSATGTRRISKVLTVVPQSTIYDNPYAGSTQDGMPPPNPTVILPTPNDAPARQVIPIATVTTTSPSNGTYPSVLFGLVALAIGIVIVFFVVLLIVRRRKRV